MNQAEIVKRYLQKREDVDICPTGHPFVTISRQAGAGGHYLGREIIRALDEAADPDLKNGWDLFDQKLCAMIAQNKDIDVSFESLLAEEYRGGVQQTVLEMLLGRPQQYNIQKKIFEVIRLLARLGKVVIIGRGAAYVTRELPGGLHIRLIAPESVRVKNMVEVLEKPEKEVLQITRKQDRDREQTVRMYFNKNVNDPLNYDMVLNTGALDSQEIAAAIVRMLVFRFRRDKKKIAPMEL